MKGALPFSTSGMQRYEDERLIYHGDYCRIVRARDVVSDELVAIKYMDRGKGLPTNVEREILNLRKLREHPHIIRFHEVAVTRDHLCLVMEYAECGNLASYVSKHSRLEEGLAKYFFHQIIFAVEYCHRQGIVNRDLNSSNVLLADASLPYPLAKLCDFGSSKAFHRSRPKTRVGTLAYMAPEIITASADYSGVKADVWSCGVMLYELLFGKWPFDISQQMEWIEYSRQNPRSPIPVGLQFPQDIPVSEDCKHLMSMMLMPDPFLRMSIERVVLHPWFQEHLPESAMTMNDMAQADMDEQKHEGQSEEEILKAVEEARMTEPNSMMDLNDDKALDEFLESTLKNDFESDMEVDAPWALVANNSTPQPQVTTGYGGLKTQRSTGSQASQASNDVSRRVTTF